MRVELARLAARAGGLAACLVLAACGGGSGSAGSTAECQPNCNASAPFLTADDVKRVIAQAVAEAAARQKPATIAVVDRVGNVLAVYQMTGARPRFDIRSGRPIVGGLDGIEDTLPSTVAAIAKAITGAYLSSAGNAFSTRTAGQIVQEHFLPGELQAPAGPLFGTQFSSLSCSDVMRNLAHGTVGPKRSPLGLSADPGGLPLYKGGAVVGGIGVMADGVYGLDLKITDTDEDVDELVAVAGERGFAPPDDIRADRITADGKTFRFVDSESILTDPAKAPAFDGLPGALVAVDGYVDAGVHAGVAFGTPASGYRAATGPFAALSAFTLVDAANAERFPPRAGSGPGALTAAEVSQILQEGIKVALRSRAQIRRPLGSYAEVSVSVVDLNGDVLGLVRTADAPIFGTDVAVQKGRTALFFSRPDAGALLQGRPAAAYLAPMGAGVTVPIEAYSAAMRSFLGEAGSLDGRTAFSTRAIGNLHRPFYPDGIEGSPPGPLSKPYSEWSPFNVGFQLDLIYNQFIRAALGDTSTGCAGRAPAGAPAGTPDGGIALLRNGVQIFPGGVPVYRNGVLIGGVGISGDGVDQDDMVALLGLANAAAALGTGIGNAPQAMRADQLTPLGIRLRYAQCPQAPFNGSSQENVCAGL